MKMYFLVLKSIPLLLWTQYPDCLSSSNLFPTSTSSKPIFAILSSFELKMTRVPKAKRIAYFEKKVDALFDLIEKKENFDKLSVMQYLVRLKRIERWYKDLVRDDVIDPNCNEQYLEVFHHIREEIYKQLSEFP